VAQGLSRRPELAENRQLVGEACERLRREKYAPLTPSVLLGTSYGGFGGGLGGNIRHASDRFDGDAVAYWEVRNLGFGEQAIRSEAASCLRQAQWREVVVLDRIAQEVVEAHAQVESRRKRIELTKSDIKAAERSYDLNLQRIENAKGLPIEALQAVQALAQSRRDYLNAVIDHNVAQLRCAARRGGLKKRLHRRGSDRPFNGVARPESSMGVVFIGGGPASSPITTLRGYRRWAVRCLPRAMRTKGLA